MEQSAGSRFGVGMLLIFTATMTGMKVVAYGSLMYRPSLRPCYGGRPRSLSLDLGTTWPAVVRDDTANPVYR